LGSWFNFFLVPLHLIGELGIVGNKIWKLQKTDTYQTEACENTALKSRLRPLEQIARCRWTVAAYSLGYNSRTSRKRALAMLERCE